jgi:hypothetical protein
MSARSLLPWAFRLHLFRFFMITYSLSYHLNFSIPGPRLLSSSKLSIISSTRVSSTLMRCSRHSIPLILISVKIYDRILFFYVAFSSILYAHILVLKFSL